jgi:polyisoprenoid-binding protein YceI
MKLIALSAVSAAAVLSAGLAHAAPATYGIDPTHTFVTFEAKHFGTSTNRGRFEKITGTVSFDKQAKSGKAEITIPTGAINTGTQAFDGHLKSKDFFNSEAFPEAKFVGDAFKFDGDKVTEVSGNLTLLGKTLPATLKASSFGCYENPRLKREVCGGDFETTIQRSAFGMNYGVPFIPDNIKLVIQIEAVKQ